LLAHQAYLSKNTRLHKPEFVTEQEIYEGIAQKDNATFLHLYREQQGKILDMVRKNKGSEEEALDIFQEGMLCLWTNIQKGKFELRQEARISTYLFSICRNLWMNRLRKKKVMVPIDSLAQGLPEEEGTDWESEYEKLKVLEGKFTQLDPTCQQMLRFFYYEKAPLKDIALAMGYTEKTAKNNKYRCMKKLRALY